MNHSTVFRQSISWIFSMLIGSALFPVGATAALIQLAWQGPGFSDTAVNAHGYGGDWICNGSDCSGASSATVVVDDLLFLSPNRIDVSPVAVTLQIGTLSLSSAQSGVVSTGRFTAFTYLGQRYLYWHLSLHTQDLWLQNTFVPDWSDGGLFVSGENMSTREFYETRSFVGGDYDHLDIYYHSLGKINETWPWVRIPMPGVFLLMSGGLIGLVRLARSVGSASGG